MSTKRLLRSSFAFWLTIVAAVLVHCGAVQARDLTFCIDKASPSAAVDARLGQAVGGNLGIAVRFFYYAGLPKGDDKDNFDLREYKELLAQNCDLVLGFPHDAQGLPKFLRATLPYASTGFVLVTPKRSRYTALDRMPQGTHVAVAYNTFANYYFRRHRNVVADIVEDDADALRSIAHKETAGALLWRPAVAQQIEERHASADVEMHELDEPNASWNLVALYSAAGEHAAHDFETAIAKLRANGELARTLGRYANATTLDDRQRTATKPAEPVGQTLADGTRNATCGSAKSAKPLPTLFTDAQAGAGKQLFSDKCALCHGQNLEGRVGPSLKGKMFLPKQAGHTVADIFRIISQNMPATMPGTLSHDEYVKIMAFLLQQNGYPAGNSELTFDAALKSKTPMIYHEE